MSPAVPQSGVVPGKYLLASQASPPALASMRRLVALEVSRRQDRVIAIDVFAVKQTPQHVVALGGRAYILRFRGRDPQSGAGLGTSGSMSHARFATATPGNHGSQCDVTSGLVAAVLGLDVHGIFRFT